MSQFYSLDIDNNPVPCANVDEWSTWFENNQNRRRVALNTTENGFRVSTVFLGLDHRFSDIGDPLLWETMIFEQGDWCDLYCARYSSYADAVEGHKKALDLATSGKIDKPSD